MFYKVIDLWDGSKEIGVIEASGYGYALIELNKEIEIGTFSAPAHRYKLDAEQRGKDNHEERN